MDTILAIDPGTMESAWVVLRDGKPASYGKAANDYIANEVHKTNAFGYAPSHLAIEMVASYGMPVGREVFETCVWIGRFIQAWGGEFTQVYRKDVKMHLCQSARAKDSNILAALLDRFGPGRSKAVGTKKAPGPCYGFSGDMWAALAVAVTFQDTLR
jgi:hypothetical protein